MLTPCPGLSPRGVTGVRGRDTEVPDMNRRAVILAVYATLALSGNKGVFAQAPAAVHDLGADDQRPPPVSEIVVDGPPGPSGFPVACPPQDRNGTLLWGYPLLDPPPALPGWFTALDVDVVGPAIKQRVIGQVLLGGAATDVELPTATLGWTGSPRIEVGYRLPAAIGELAVSYQLLATEGSGTISGFDAAGNGALKQPVGRQRGLPRLRQPRVFLVARGGHEGPRRRLPAQHLLRLPGGWRPA